jgi:hypothetical protein
MALDLQVEPVSPWIKTRSPTVTLVDRIYLKNQYKDIENVEIRDEKRRVSRSHQQRAYGLESRGKSMT